MRKLKMIFYFIFIATILSCNSDDNEINQTNELVGVWQRSDFSENFEYKLYLNSDYTGMITSSEYFDDGKAISNALTVTWSAIDNQLTLLIADEEINTPYSFNADGQLILRGLTDLPFNKLE